MSKVGFFKELSEKDIDRNRDIKEVIEGLLNYIPDTQKEINISLTINNNFISAKAMSDTDYPEQTILSACSNDCGQHASQSGTNGCSTEIIRS